VGVGIAVAGACCVALMRVQAGARAAWILLGAIALAVTALLWPLFGGDGRAVGPPAPRAAGRERFWSADRVRLVLCYGTLGLGYIIPATFIPALARQIVSDPAVFGWAWPVFGVAAAASTFAAAPLARVLATRRIWALSHLVLAVGVACPVVWPGMAGIIAAALLVGGTFMVATMTGMQEARRVGGARATVLMAALTSAFALGQIVGPLLVSALLLAHLPVSGALLGSAALLVTSAVVLTGSSPAAPGSSPAAG
jgi:predicted MFS family arabinose efflux permease